MPSTRTKVPGSLADAAVVLVGIGNIGSPLAWLLARAGVGRLRLVDRDRVEEKNLAAQDYRPEDVGRFKAEVVAERLRRVFPWLRIEARVTDLEDVPLGDFEVDLILGALDSRRARQVLVSEVAWPLGVPVVDGGVGDGWRGRVQTFVPGPDAACLECTWSAADYRGLAVEYPCVPGAAATAPPTAAPAFLGTAVAAWMTAEAVRLLGSGAAEVGCEIAFDLLHRRHLVSRLRRSPHCRFDHEVVSEVLRLEKAFVAATAGDLLSLIQSSGAAPTCVECRRGLLATEGFASTRLVALDDLRLRSAEPLAALGFRPADRVRLRRGERRAFIALGGVRPRM